jgi:hypothetical protein
MLFKPTLLSTNLLNALNSSLTDASLEPLVSGTTDGGSGVCSDWAPTVLGAREHARSCSS